jgi:protocatechuate 3,4-dioxygenase beta subunit
MKTPLDNDLNNVYDAFKQDHKRLRRRLMDSVDPCSKRNRQINPLSYVWDFIGGTIMRNRMTKFATAVVIAGAIIIGVKSFNGSTAWADVIKALNGADNIHITTKVIRPNGQVSEHHTWLKNKTMFRDDDPDNITIDNGENRLNLDIEKKTAQLSDSHSPFEDYMETGNFEIILLFRGRETPFKATELPEESTDDMQVYEITYRDTWKGKAWVDAKNNLPSRISATFAEQYRDRVLTMEVIYDYQPIPAEMFSLTVPPGYTKIARVESRVFSGKVIDENGKPVIGADVVTSDEDIRGQTGENGEFVITLHPGIPIIRRFPMVVRAFKSDDPNRVAWTLLRNPRHELRPRFRPDDGKTKFEQGGGVDIILVDEKKLREFIPADPGTMIFKNETDRKPSEVRDMVLRMRPASVITGRIVDQGGQPIVNAVVWIEYMVIAVGENEIEIRDLRHTAKEREIISSLNREISEEVERKAFAVTDANGCYELGRLPDVWYRVRLEVMADGYVSEAREIFQPDGADFSLFEAGVTIRGTVIDNHGQPLVGREIEIGIETDDDTDDDRDIDVEEVIIDAQGRFELTGVPAVDGLELQIRTDEKPRDWDRNDLTRDLEFIYYLMIEEPIKLEPDKNEYDIKIIPHRPDISLEIEVKDSKGNLLEGVPVGISGFGNTERIWYLTKLTGKTNEKGLCTIDEVPRMKPLSLWISNPPTRYMRYWEDGADGAKLNPEIKKAITEYLWKYNPTIVPVQLEKEKKMYRISVTLQ